MKTQYIIIALIICFCFSIIFAANQQVVEAFETIKSPGRQIKWKREGTCKYYLNKTVSDVLTEYGFDETKEDDYVMYFPCTYNNIQNEVKQSIPTTPKGDQRFFIVNNADQLSSKDHIWKNLVKTYGRKHACTIMPKSYILYQDLDIILFKKEYDEKKIYIMKKNIQRQEGLKITRDKDTILKGINDSYVVVQELLQDPYIIDGRKTNMRFYLLLVCKNNEISAYVHDNGFMYYTKVPFKKDSTDADTNITTGYIDREVYEKNPLTLKDMRGYLDSSRELSVPELNIMVSGNKISEYAFKNVDIVLNKLVKAIKHTVCVGSHLQNNISFQLFGVDVAFNEKLDAQIIEVNKGPDLGKKDEKDGTVKKSVVVDMLKVIKVIDSEDHGYKKIYED